MGDDETESLTCCDPDCERPAEWFDEGSGDQWCDGCKPTAPDDGLVDVTVRVPPRFVDHLRMIATNMRANG